MIFYFGIGLFSFRLMVWCFDINTANQVLIDITYSNGRRSPRFQERITRLECGGIEYRSVRNGKVEGFILRGPVQRITA